jgi:hypothetical protein
MQQSKITTVTKQLCKHKGFTEPLMNNNKTIFFENHKEIVFIVIFMGFLKILTRISSFIILF